MKRIAKRLSRFGPSQNGAAAVEFALWLMVTLWPLLNVIDVGFYAYDRTQVENSAQMAVQAVSTACGQQVPNPVITNCKNLTGITTTTLMTNRAQSTSLGTQVTLTGVYECSGGTATATTGTVKNSDCPSNSGDYVGAQTSFTYAPIFGAVTIASILGTSISRTYWTRVI